MPRRSVCSTTSSTGSIFGLTEHASQTAKPPWSTANAAEPGSTTGRPRPPAPAVDRTRHTGTDPGRPGMPSPLLPLGAKPGHRRRGQTRARAEDLLQGRAKSLPDNPCRYSNASTSATFGDLRHHGGRIAEETAGVPPSPHRHACRSPAGANTSTAPAPVTTCRATWWWPLRTTSRRPLVDLALMRLDILGDLVLQRRRQHPPGTLADQFVQQRHDEPAAPSGQPSTGSRTTVSMA
jgi:hypothetical protein